MPPLSRHSFVYPPRHGCSTAGVEQNIGVDLGRLHRADGAPEAPTGHFLLRYRGKCGITDGGCCRCVNWEEGGMGFSDRSIERMCVSRQGSYSGLYITYERWEGESFT